MAARFAVFYVMRVNYQAVTLPNGEVKKAPVDDTANFLRRWWDKHEADELRARFDEELSQWQQQLRTWKSGCRVDEGKGRIHGGPRVEVSNITYPNGKRVTVERHRADDAITTEFTELYPRPLPTENRLNVAYGDWVKGTSSKNVRSWTAGLVEGDRETEIEIGVPQTWPCGMPAREIVQQLDVLAADGWKLINVSEDRGIYRGEDARTDSSPTTIRYLLQRAG